MRSVPDKYGSTAMVLAPEGGLGRQDGRLNTQTAHARLTQGSERPEALQERKHNQQHNNEADNIKTPVDEA